MAWERRASLVPILGPVNSERISLGFLTCSWGDSQPSHHADDSDGDAWPDLPAGSAAGLSEGTDVKQVI